MFIQVIHGRCSRQDELRGQLDRWREELGDDAGGWLGATYGFTDDDEFLGVVRFESRESAMANSDRPEQGAWWADTEPLFDGPVAFHDCDRVLTMLDGGSDEAGFVQVIRGRTGDPDLLESTIRRTGDLLRDARPEIIGATVGLEDDGTFTQTVAFTDEAAAREGESKELPLGEEARAALREWDENVRDLRYYDLHRPWFVSR